MRFAVIGLLAFSGLVWSADLNDSYKALKDAFEKKDIAQVKVLSAETAKEARELAKEKQPADAGEAEAYKARQAFAKDAEDYAEYALAVSATQATDPAVTIDLTETLIAQDPKSEQIDIATPQYLAALNKQSPAKANAAASKILVGRPDNEYALDAVARNWSSTGPALAAANRLIGVMGRKKKPEGMSYADADRNLKAALPLVGGSSTSYIYYYLGVSNYQMGKLTTDKAKMATGLQYTEKAAATAGPMQTQASNNAAIMKREMGGR